MQDVGPTLAASFGVGFVGLLLPRGLLRRSFAIPPLLFLLYNLRQHTSGVWEQDYLAAIQITGFLVKTVDLCVVHDAERDFQKTSGDDGTQKLGQDVRSMSTWQRFWWKFDLWTSLRGTGWNWKVKNVPVVEETSRRCDTIHLTRLLFLTFTADLC
jgi:hypothetical protein